MIEQNWYISDVLNLVENPWIPARRADGSIEIIAPWQITDGIAGANPFVGFAWPRADFDGVVHEFAIGLFSTAAAPADEDQWLDWWHEPPPPEILRQRFAGIASAFILDGGGPRFMQDRDELADFPEVEAGALLIDAPGENTLRKNADLFVKRGGVATLSRPAAAMALFTLQTYAPSGGQGHRTSLRGGGPLTTLAIGGRAERRATLWDRLWPNVETREAIENRRVGIAQSSPERIFPWLAPTRISDPKAQGRPTSPPDVDPLQVYWGMPRRIRLLFEPGEGRRCDLTGAVDEIVVRAFRTRNYGTQYAAGFLHPLSPYYKPKKGAAENLPVHPQPGGISYRHWLGMVVSDKARGSSPAEAVKAALRRFEGLQAFDSWRLVAFGYDMDNMKARGWSQSEAPIEPSPNGFLEAVVPKLVLAAEAASRALIGQVKAALYDRSADAPGDFGFIGERFWRETEPAFYDVLDEARKLYDPEELGPERPALAHWVRSLRRHVLALFDEYAPPDAIEDRDMKRQVKARFFLLMAFEGAVKEALGLVTAKERKARRK